MRKSYLFLIVLLGFILAACAGSGEGEPAADAVPEPAGPALIMFYTDN
jgi:hypothetical protein